MKTSQVWGGAGINVRYFGKFLFNRRETRYIKGLVIDTPKSIHEQIWVIIIGYGAPLRTQRTKAIDGALKVTSVHMNLFSTFIYLYKWVHFKLALKLIWVSKIAQRIKTSATKAWWLAFDPWDSHCEEENWLPQVVCSLPHSAVTCTHVPLLIHSHTKCDFLKN